jgi:hypothetical protein
MEKSFLLGFGQGDLRAAQHLASGQKFGLLFEEILQELDGVAKVAELDRRHGFKPIASQLVAKILFGSGGHGSNPLLKDLRRLVSKKNGRADAAAPRD